MWIPKHERDQERGVDSSIPTQAVSSEEFIPRPQADEQEQWEKTAGEKWLKGDCCFFDVQTHFTNNFPLPMRTGWVCAEG